MTDRSNVSIAQFCRFALVVAAAVIFAASAIHPQRPEVVVQSGQNAGVKKIAFSKDGSLLASADDEGTIVLWDLATYKQVRSFRGTAAVDDIAFSEDGSILYAAFLDRCVKSFETDTGKEVMIVESSPNYRKAASSLDTTNLQVAQVVKNGDLRVIDLRTGKPVFTYSLPPAEREKMQASADSGDFIFLDGEFSSTAFGPKGEILAAGLKKIAFIGDRDKPARWIAKADQATHMTFNPDGKLIAVAEKIDGKAVGDEKTSVTLRSAESGAIIRQLEMPEGEATSLSFAPDGKAIIGLVVVFNNGASTYTQVMWDVGTGKRLGESVLGNYPTDIAEYFTERLSADGKFIAIGLGDTSSGRVLVREFGSRTAVAELGKQIHGGSSKLRFLKEGRLGAGYGLLDLRYGKLVFERLMFRDSFSSDGTRFSSGDGVKKVRPRPDEILATYGGGCPGLSDPLTIFSPDDRFVLAFKEKSGRPCLFDANDGRLLMKFPDAVSKVVFSGDGRYLAYDGILDKGKAKFAVKIWRLDTTIALAKQIDITLDQAMMQNLTATREPFQVESIDLTSDGSRLAVAYHTAEKWNTVNVAIFNTANGTQTGLISDGGNVVDVAFDPTEPNLIGMTNRSTPGIWDCGTGKKVNDLSGDVNWLRKVAFSKDGRFLTVIDGDGQVVFWNKASGEMVARLLYTSLSDFIFITPDNYYLASRKGAARAVAFRQGRHAYPFEQFDIRYNRPDIVLSRLGFATSETIDRYAKAYQKRLRLNGVRESDWTDRLTMPDVSILNTTPTTTRERELKLTIAATDTVEALARLNVYVNDVPALGLNGIDLGKEHAKNAKRDVQIALSQGMNRIQVSATNFAGTESVRRTINVRYDGPTAPPQLYLVTVGVSKYANSAYNLTYPAQDAANIAKLFDERAAEKERVMYVGGAPPGVDPNNAPKSFYKTNRLDFRDEDVVLEKLESIREFLKPAGPDDEIVIFVAGHGLLDAEKNFYFATHDIDFKDPQKRGLSFDKLQELMDAGNSRRKLLLIDSCHAGEVDKGETAGPSSIVTGGQVTGRSVGARSDLVNEAGATRSDDVMSDLFADLRLGSGTVVISASGGLEYAFESAEWSGGVFTYALRLGLAEGKADKNNNGQTTVSELRSFVDEKVSELTKGRQKPTARSESVEFDFRVY